ncbi:MAG: TonB C-terminal domain-containing protein [Gemmatimonadota bacterium]
MTTRQVRDPRARLGLPVTLSLVLHASIIVTAFVLAHGHEVVLPPVYQVDLVAAPAGPRAIGQVTEAATPPPPVPEPAPPPKRAAAPVESPVPVPVKQKPPPVAKKVTPTTPVPNATKTIPKDTPAAKAGGGPEGGKGADVANVSIQGIQFPYPAYLENIVRQIALRFKPRTGQALVAEVVFLIRRDGSMTGFSFRRRSGAYEFDLEAQGAVEAAARSGSFGALPDGFGDDVLTVIFSFDPQLIR